MSENHNLSHDEIKNLALAIALKCNNEEDLDKTIRQTLHLYRIACERILKIDLEDNPPAPVVYEIK